MTRTNLCAFALFALALLLGAPRVAIAAEGYGNCDGVISSLPTVISTSGTWCLKQNLNTSIASGNAIDIQADNVTIDCNDFKLTGTAAAASTQANGIHSGGLLNTVVRHCDVRGFYYGLYFVGGGGGHLVEDNRFDSNTYQSLRVSGDGSMVRRNLVFNTSGSTINGGLNGAYGIVVYDSVDVLDNTVSGVIADPTVPSGAIGIYAGSAGSASISGNRVRGMVRGSSGNTFGSAFGIYSDSTGRLTLRNNDVVGDASTYSVGLLCANANGRAKDNVISGFATAFDTCSNNGGNVIKP